MNDTIRHFFIVACLSIFTIPLQAQDLIVTQEGDSLNCKITKVKTDYIYFTFKHNEEIKNSLLPMGKVVYYQTDYYSVAEVPSDKIPKTFPRFRAAIGGGWNYIIVPVSENVPADFKHYAKQLKSGFQYDVNLSYYFSKQTGIGLKYNAAHSSNEIDNVFVEYPDGHIGYGKMSDNIRVNFIGPFFSSRLFTAKTDNCLLMDAGLGYVGYRNKCVLVSQNLTLTGFTIGLYANIGYDIAVSQNWAIGFQFSLITGVLSQIKITDGINTETKALEKNEYEGLSRITLSIGLRYNK